MRRSAHGASRISSSRGLVNYCSSHRTEVAKQLYKYDPSWENPSTRISILNWAASYSRPGSERFTATLLEPTIPLPNLPCRRVFDNKVDEGPLILRDNYSPPALSLNLLPPPPTIPPHVWRQNLFRAFISLLTCGPDESSPALHTGEIVHASRCVGRISTAASKLWEIFAHFPPGNFDNVICLAEGSGSCFLLAAHYFHDSQLYYNTLKGLGVDDRGNPADHHPPSLIGDPCYCTISNRMVNSRSLMTGTTDITSPRRRRDSRPSGLRRGVQGR